MLALDRPLGSVAGLSLFADHEDDGLIWFLPDRPRIALAPDGGPELSLVRIDRDVSELGADDATSVGALSLTAELDVGPERIEAVREALAEQGQPVDTLRFAMAPFTKGTAVLATTLARQPQDADGAPIPDAAPVFAELTLGETTPSMVDTHRALFGLRLPSRESVDLLQQLVTDGGVVPIGVRYELTYEGIRPAVEAKITARYQNFFDSTDWGFDIGASYQKIGLGVAVGKAVEKLREQGHITVEITSFTSDAQLRKATEEALTRIQERIIADFFRPSLTPPEVDPSSALMQAIETAASSLGLAAGQLGENPQALGKVAEMLGINPSDVTGALGGGAVSDDALPITAKLRFSYKKVKREELKTLVLDLRTRAAEERVVAPQGLLSDLGISGGWADRVTTVQLEDDVVDVAVRPSAGLAELGVGQILVHLRYPNTDEGEVTTHLFEADDAEPRAFRFRTTADGGRAYGWQVELHVRPDAPWAAASPSFTSPWQQGVATTLVANPRALTRLVEIEVAPGDLDVEAVPTTRVELALVPPGADAPSEVRQELVLTADAPGGRWPVRLDPGVTVAARFTWLLATGGQVSGDWLPVEGATVLVPAPWKSWRELRLMPVLPPDIRFCDVVARLEDGEDRAEQQVSFEPGARRPVAVRLPSLQDRPPPAVLEITVLRGDLTLYQPEPRQTEERFVVVTDQDGEPRRVTVTLLGPPRLADLGLSAVRVEVLDADGVPQAGTLFAEGARDPVTLTVGLTVEAGEEPPALRYAVTRFGLDGRVSSTGEGVVDGSDVVVPAFG